MVRCGQLQLFFISHDTNTSSKIDAKGYQLLGGPVLAPPYQAQVPNGYLAYDCMKLLHVAHISII